MKVTTLLLVLTATLSGFAQATVRGANEADHTAHRKLDSGKGKGKGKGQRMMMMTTSGPECPKDPFPPPAAGYCPLPGKYEPKENVFDQLSPEETQSVIDYLVDLFGLVTEEPSAEECSYAHRLFKAILFPTPKDEVLAYLDGDGPKPKRYAKAMIIRGPEDIMFYKVGPLPLGNSPKVYELTEPGEIPWGSRPYLGCESAQADTIIAPAAVTLAPLFKAMTGGFCYGLDECPSPGIFYSLTADPASSPFQRISMVRWRYSPSAFTNLVIDPPVTGSPSSSLYVFALTWKIYHGGPNYKEDWYVGDFELCGQGPFATAEDLLEAWKDGKLDTCATGADAKHDASYGLLSRRDVALRQYSEKPPPILTEPEGHRFSVEGRTVSWFDWEFHVDLSPSWGPILSNVKFKGERILYELSLQETYAAYSGNSGHGEIMFLDSHYGGLGNRAFPVAKGMDCPETSFYLPGPDARNPFSPAGQHEDAQCIYEMITGDTSVRHYGGGFAKSQPKAFLAVGQVITVGNYDYIIRFEFHYDGEMFVKIDAAGYMQTSYWYKGEEGFGHPVQLWQKGTLHDHIFSFKLDFDILGTANSFQETRFEVVPADGPTNTGQVIKKAVYDKKKQETGLVVDSTVANTFTVYNPNEYNKWGSTRGYSMHFEGSIYNYLPPSHPWSRAASWSNYNVLVTKRKEEEPESSFEGNMLVGSYPVVDAAKFDNGECIEEEDLVVWATVGKMHLPRSEDMPVVTNFGVSLAIRPYNYFDENAAFDIPYKTQDFNVCTPVAGKEYEYNYSTL